MGEFVDEKSGLRYRKRPKPILARAMQQLTEAGNEFLNNSNEETVSLTKSNFSADTTKTIETMNNSRPNVPVTDWFQYMPSEWSNTSKMRQLLIWSAEMELQDELRIKIGKTTVADKVKKDLIDKLKSSNSVVSLYKHPDVLPPIGRNARNIRNEKLLIEYGEDLAILKDETELWKKCEYKICEDHALVMDKIAVSEANEYKVDQSKDFWESIEPDQREYLKKLLVLEREPQIGELTTNIHADIARYRQILHIVTEFNEHCGKLVKKTKCELAHILKENSRVVPINKDERTLGLFEDTEAKRKEHEIRNVEHVFKLLSRSTSNIHITEESSLEAKQN